MCVGQLFSIIFFIWYMIIYWSIFQYSVFWDIWSHIDQLPNTMWFGTRPEKNEKLHLALSIYHLLAMSLFSQSFNWLNVPYQSTKGVALIPFCPPKTQIDEWCSCKLNNQTLNKVYNAILPPCWVPSGV